jgi:hypothetical protein
MSLVEIPQEALRHCPHWGLEEFGRKYGSGYISGCSPAWVDTAGYDSEISPDLYWISREAAGLAFVFNGQKYLALEDSQDGYRSSLDFVFRLPDWIEIPNVFDNVPVYCQYTRGVPPTDKEDMYGVTELIVFRNMKNGKPILTIGTENLDDYYPNSVLLFEPKNIGTVL